MSQAGHRFARLVPISLVPRLITFGGLSVENGTVINGLANPRSRLAILAVLATAGERGIRRDKLVALFWPDSDEERARNALRQSLFSLKKDLGAGEITVGGTELRLNPEALSSDVADFDGALQAGRFEEAAELYRGPFLDGVFLRESPEFERWAEDQRNRLAGEFRRALEKAATLAKSRGDLTRAVHWWERLASHDPLSGRIARAYMEALADAGERERAILHAETHARLVRQELDAEPDPDVLQVATRLRDAPAARAIPPAGVTVSTQVGAPPPDGGVPAPTSEGARAGSRRLSGQPATWIGLGAVLASSIAIATTLKPEAPPVHAELVAIGFFENRTSEPAVDLVAEMAASEIAQLLSESQRATVTDLRGSVSEGTGSSPAARTRAVAKLARAGTAGHLVQGYVDKRGDSVVVFGQVLNARTGNIVHQLEHIAPSNQTPRQILEPLRESIGGAVMALTDSIFRSSWGGPRPPKYSAYVEFMRGIDALVQRYEPNAATPYFQKAMALDPDFVQAKLLYLDNAGGPSERERMDSVRTVLKALYPRMTAYDKAATDRQFAVTEARFPDAFTAARQMVSLAPRSPDALMFLAHASMATKRYRRVIESLHTLRASPGWLKDMNDRRFMDYQAHRLLGDFKSGIEEFRRDVAEAVNDPGICQYGFPLLAAAGDEQAVDSLLLSCTGVRSSKTLQAAQLQIAGRNYRMAGHREPAERALRRALAMRIELATQDTLRWFGVVQAHADLGEWRQAYDVLKSRSTLGPAQRVMFGTAAGYAGDTATALQTLNWLQEAEGTHANRAFILIALGRHDQAIEALTTAMDSGTVPGWSQWYIRPELHAIRANPRFEALIRPVRP